MNANRKNEIVRSWMAISDALAGTELYESNFWAYEELTTLCEEKPEDAWEVIRELVAAAKTDQLLEAIGAGPLQDLMAHHGEKYISQVEQEATVNGRFRAAMASAWLDRDDTPVWKRFYEIAGVEPPFPEEEG